MTRPDPGRDRRGQGRSARTLGSMAAVYVAVALGVMEAADIAVPRLGLPDRWVTAVVVLCVLGFPVTIGLLWLRGRDGRVLPAGPAGSDGTAKKPGVRKRLIPAAALAVGLLAVVLVGYGAWTLSRRSDDAAAGPAGEQRIAVLPFTVRADPSYAYLGAGMVDLLSTKLDGAGRLRTVPARAVLGLANQVGLSEPDPEAAGRIASQLSADYFVLGTLVGTGSSLHIEADLYEVGRPQPVSDGSREGPADELFRLVDDVTAQLVAGMEGSPAGRVTRLAALTTNSLPALKAYLEGEELFRGGHFASALAAFEAALRLDSTFALAHYRLSVAREWAGQEGATEAAAAALRHASRLSDRDRQLVDALNAWRLGDGERARQIYRSILGTWPDDVEAWLQLAEIENHFSPLRGGSVETSRLPFQRVVSFEPEHVGALWHLARVELASGNPAGMDSLVERVRQLAPEGDRILELLALRAAVTRPEEFDGVIRSLGNAQDNTRWTAVWTLAVFAEDLPKARIATGPLIEPSRSSEVQATGHLIDAWLALASGRPGEADAGLARVESIDPELGLVFQAAATLLPFRSPGAGSLDALHDRLVAWTATTGCRSSNPVRYFEPGTCILPVVRSFLIGLTEARRRRFADALARADELEAFARDGIDEGHGRDFAATVRADVALIRGDTAAALRTLEQASWNVWYVKALQSFFYSHGYARFRRAQALEAMGRPEEALRWFDSFDELTLYDLVFLAPAQLRATGIEETIGRTIMVESRRARTDRLLAGSEPGWREAVGAGTGGDPGAG